MKRLLRWLFNFAAAVSLVICVGMVGLWIRSYWVGERISLILYPVGYNPNVTNPASYELISIAGSISLQRSGDPAPSGFSNWSFAYRPYGVAQQSWATNLSSIRTYSFVRGPASAGIPAFWFFGIPNWFIILPSAILPCIWIVRRKRRVRRNRIATGLCPKCGYDLRATPDRCPECGTIPPAAKGVAT